MGRRVRQASPAVVLADKPEGLGSAALVARLRKELDGVRVGHAGTLDRFATGLMLLLVGQGTALADVLLHQDKTYLATFVFGRATDTHDPTGETVDLRTADEARIFMEENRDRIAAELARIEASREQTPPAFSALKQAGKRFSDLARSGAAVLPKSRPVRIYSLETTDFDPASAQLIARIDVSSGTYIRSIARDLGAGLDFPVHLGALRRTRIGPLSLEHPRLWRPEEGAGPQALSPLQALPDWRRQPVQEADFEAIGNGQRIEIELRPGPGEDFFLIGPDERPLAWCRGDGQGSYSYRRVFSSEIK